LEILTGSASFLGIHQEQLVKKSLWICMTIAAMGICTAAAAANGSKTLQKAVPAAPKQHIAPAKHARAAKVSVKNRAHKTVRRPQKSTVKFTAPAVKSTQLSRMERRQA
jgi:DNA transposition AAA+ family ATPase